MYFCYCYYICRKTLHTTRSWQVIEIWNWVHNNQGRRLVILGHLIIHLTLFIKCVEIFIQVCCLLPLTLVLLRYFCNTSSEGGGLLQPLPGLSIRNAWYPYICYQCIGMDHLYPLIPKWVPLNFIWRHYDIIKSARPHKFGCFVMKISKIDFSLKKS